MLSTLRKKPESPRSRRPMASGGSQPPEKVPPPLNLENVTTVVEKLPYDMWKEWDKGNRAPRTGVRSIHYSPSFRLELGLSEKQCIAIKLNERFSFLGDRIRAGMMWWLQYHPQASWRKLICAIDAVTPVEQRFWEFDLRKLADEIRGYAEPVKDSSLRTSYITSIMEVVENIDKMACLLQVPIVVWDSIKCTYMDYSWNSETTHSRRKAKCQALGVYWRDTVPGASWETLAAVLYQMGEQKALERVRIHLLPIKDTSLSKKKVMDVVRGVNYLTLKDILGTPLSKQDEFVQLYKNQSVTQLTEAAVHEYLTSHPCPSWAHLASSIQLQHILYPDIVPASVVEKAAKCVEDSASARSIVEAAMREGYTPRRDNTFLIVGPGGSGKTTLIDRFLGEDLDPLRRSTKLGMHPIRTISLLRFSVKGKVWKRVNLDNLSEMIADASLNPSLLMHEVSTEWSSSEPSPHSVNSAPNPATSPPSPQQPLPPASRTCSSSSSKEHSPVSSESKKSSTSQVPFQEDIGRLVDKLRRYRNLLETDWIHLVDSGGQPQFHEVMAIFYRRLSGYISVFKLSEPLSFYNRVVFFKDGKPTPKPYSSAYSNEHIIRCNMRAVQFGASKHKKRRMTKLAFVATHRDEDCSAEPLEEKNKKIHRIIMDILSEKMCEGVISRGGCLEKSVFAVNLLNPDDTDWEALVQLQENLMIKDPVAEEDKLPLRFYGLEIALLKLMKKLGRQVLSWQECLDVAIGLHFKEESFKVAVQFLSNLNIIHHDEDELPNVVFGSSQVILDKISEIVVYSLQLREDPDMKCKAIDGKLQKFRDQGILTIEILSKFDAHYIAGLFSPNDVIRMLHKFLVIAEIGIDEYFMPSLLVPSSHLLQSRQSAQAIPSFALYFEKGGPQVGVFCSKVSSLIKDHDWKLYRVDGRVFHVSRNCIIFHVPGKGPGKLSLIDRISNHIEVRLEDVPTDDLSELQEITITIRDTLISAFDKASKTHDSIDEKPEYAFMCPEQSQKCSPEPHPASVNDRKTRLMCTINPSIHQTLSNLHKMWLSASSPDDLRSAAGEEVKVTSSIASSTHQSAQPEPTSSMPSEAILDTQRPTLIDMMLFQGKKRRFSIPREIGKDFYTFGMLLLNDPNGKQISNIRHKYHNDVEEINNEILQEWVKGISVTWETLVKTLKNVELNSLAEEIAEVKLT